MTVVHADTVGSYIRPDSISEGRRKFVIGALKREELNSIEEKEIKKLVEQQAACGLVVVNDGEWRKNSYCDTFWLSLGGIEERIGAKNFVLGKNPAGVNPLALEQGMKETMDDIMAEARKSELAAAAMAKQGVPYVVGKIKFNPNHPEFAEFLYLKSVAPAGTIPKVIIPSPTFIIECPDTQGDVIPQIYATYDEYVADVSAAYRETILKFYELGARRIQIDEPTWMMLPFVRKTTKEEQVAEVDRLIGLSVRVLTPVLKDLPADLKIGYHQCKGNGRCRYNAPYDYHNCLPGWTALQPDFLLIEYDTERAGDFTALQKVATACPKVVVHLGLVSSKTDTVETVEYLEKKVDEAAQYFPKERLGLCTQCGFQTGLGSISPCGLDSEWKKVAVLAAAAKKIWGNA